MYNLITWNSTKRITLHKTFNRRYTKEDKETNKQNEQETHKTSKASKYMQIGIIGMGILSGLYLFSRYNKCENQFVENLEGKYILITGGSDGIGYQTALALARMHGTVIIASRSRERLNDAAQRLRHESGNQNVYTIELDLGSFESVENLVVNCEKFGWKFDYLVNNAGVMKIQRELTKEGHEMNMGVNYIGHFFLTVSLLNSGLLSDDARIVNLSSRAHTRGDLDFDDFDQIGKTYTNMDAYATSKLANIYFTVALKKRLEEMNSSITTCALHPGVVNTNLFSFLTTPVQVIFAPFAFLFFSTVKEGAQTSLYCILNPSLENGAYYDNCRKSNLHLSDIEAKSEKLWEVSEELCKIKLQKLISENWIC